MAVTLKTGISLRLSNFSALARWVSKHDPRGRICREQDSSPDAKPARLAIIAVPRVHGRTTARKPHPWQTSRLRPMAARLAIALWIYPGLDEVGEEFPIAALSSAKPNAVMASSIRAGHCGIHISIGFACPRKLPPRPNPVPRQSPDARARSRLARAFHLVGA